MFELEKKRLWGKLMTVNFVLRVEEFKEKALRERFYDDLYF